MMARSGSQKLLTTTSIAALSSVVMVTSMPTMVYAQSPLCASSSTDATIEWMTRVQIAGGNLNIPVSTNYLDGSDTPLATVQAGQTFSVEADVDVEAGSTYNEYVIIWLDLNQDGVIDDASERVFQQNQNVTDAGVTFSGSSVSIPSTAFNGPMYGRAIMQYAASPALCGTYTYGTTADFQVSLEGGDTNPAAPQAPTAVVAVAGNGEATVSFLPPASGPAPDEYVITIQPTGQQIVTSGSPVTIPALTNGTEYTFEVVAKIGDTLFSPVATSNAITPAAPDVTAPATPPVPALTDATNSGSTADTITNVAEAEITGTAEANAEVEVFVDGVSVGTTTANSTGDWSFTFADGDLANDDNAVTVAATDAANNTSAASAPLTITLDEITPDAPTGLALTDATNSGSTADTITNVAEAEITGTAEANAEVEVFVDGVSVGTTTANSTGDWSFTFADGDLANDDNAVTVAATDAANNTSAASAPLTITLDTGTPQAAPDVTISEGGDSGEGGDNITNVSTPEIGGTIEPGAEVEIFVGGVSVGTVTADSSGDWSFTFADGDLAEGDNVITAAVTDAAGNTSPQSAPQTIMLDTVAPTAVFDTPAGIQSGPFDASITFSEPVDELNLAELIVENGTVSNLTTADNMTFTFTVTPTANGPITMSVAEGSAADVADNVNGSASSAAIAADIVAPTVTISGPSAAVTDTFQVDVMFSEDVTGFTIDDIVVSGGTASNFQGTGANYTVDVTPVVGELVTVNIAGAAAQDEAGNDSEVADTFSVQSGSPAFEFTQVEDEVRDIVANIATRDLQNRIASNRQLVDDARARFIGSRNKDSQCFTDERGQVQCPDGVGRRNVPLNVTGDLKFSENMLSTRGSFFGQRGDANGDVWRVISGNFNLTRDDDGCKRRLEGTGFSG